ncbi:Protein CBG26572 [Caenorhabditis briggsae]|uniref:Protein CBG26572 n=1 Tax=Caenorhabditis briggsae TaxID=6238 RepID=B6IE19_CAEBR|nr:Protein CBG26572 [Caenorhabditis briggsae]CAS01083.1 Protein CBG26572 [Caenorhabditis briggsae]
MGFSKNFSNQKRNTKKPKKNLINERKRERKRKKNKK